MFDTHIYKTMWISLYLPFILLVTASVTVNTIPITAASNDIYSNGAEETQGKTWNSACKNTDECPDTLFCIHRHCRCAEEDYWSLNKCRPKKDFATSCSSSYECIGKLMCLHGNCGCSRDLFWNGISCLTRKTVNSLCNESSECEESLRCNSQTCQCSAKHFWDATVCAPKKPVDMECRSTLECQDNLFCVQEHCQCASSSYWTGDECSYRKTVNSSCGTNTECTDTLQCINQRCQCCITDFWDGTTCRKRKTFNTECMSTTSCQDGLQCSDKLCKCPINDYWNESQCENRRSFGLPCLATDNCQTTLFCNHNTCQCAAGEYWNGSLCSKRKPLDGSCMLDTECEISLRCLSNRCQYCPFECSGVLSQADGVYTICPRGSHKQTTAYCITRGDKTWTVIQRRTEGLVDFYRSWVEYKVGFGLRQGEYWLGNDNIHWISSNGNHELSIYLEAWDGTRAFANYSLFNLGNEDTKYKLTIGGYTGNAGDSLVYSNQRMFSTYDQDNDQSDHHCSVLHHGAWWYGGCTYSNLNGKYNATQATQKLIWHHWRPDYSLKGTLMMIRKL